MTKSCLQMTFTASPKEVPVEKIENSQRMHMFPEAFSSLLYRSEHRKLCNAATRTSSQSSLLSTKVRLSRLSTSLLPDTTVAESRRKCQLKPSTLRKALPNLLHRQTKRSRNLHLEIPAGEVALPNCTDMKVRVILYLSYTLSSHPLQQRRASRERCALID